MAERRRAVGFLGARDVARLLALPEGIRVIGVRDDFMRDGVLVGLESEAFDPVPEGAEAPRYESPLAPYPMRPMRDAPVSGWGPDFKDVIIQCPMPDCGWEYESGAREITLGDLIDAVSAHLVEAHPGA